MQPKEDDYTIKIPSAFEQNFGRTDKKSSKIIVIVVLILFWIIVLIGAVRSDNRTILAKLITTLGVTFGVAFILRFIVFSEAIYSDAYEGLKEQDYTPNQKSYWTIYKISDRYPYICNYRNGLKGIFVAFTKDVVVGKADTVMFDHYEAIGDAYQLAGATPINIRPIDYMSDLGSDTRLNDLFSSLQDCDNPDLVELLFEIYDNLGFQMSKDYASFDVYLFTGNLSDESLWYHTQRILSVFIESNYLSYKVMNASAIESLCKIIFNRKSFNIQEACESVFSSETFSGIVPIRLIKPDGSEVKFHDTFAEKAEKERLMREEVERKKQEWKQLSMTEKLKRRFSIVYKLYIMLQRGIEKRVESRTEAIVDMLSNSNDSNELVNNTDLAGVRASSDLVQDELNLIAENEEVYRENKRRLSESKFNSSNEIDVSNSSPSDYDDLNIL